MTRKQTSHLPQRKAKSLARGPKARPAPVGRQGPQIIINRVQLAMIIIMKKILTLSVSGRALHPSMHLQQIIVSPMLHNNLHMTKYS